MVGGPTGRLGQVLTAPSGQGPRSSHLTIKIQRDSHSAQELIERLQECAREAEVRIMSQESWPFENPIVDVAVREHLVSDSEESPFQVMVSYSSGGKVPVRAPHTKTRRKELESRSVTHPVEQSRKPLIVVVAAGVVLAATITGVSLFSRSGEESRPAVAIAPIPVATAAAIPRGDSTSGRLQVWLVASQEQYDSVAQMLTSLPGALSPNVQLHIVPSPAGVALGELPGMLRPSRHPTLR